MGIILLIFTYKEEFKETSVGELINSPGEKGIIFGKVEYVINNYPYTLLQINDGNKALVYYPKPTTLTNEDFVKVYAENQLEENFNKKNSEKKLFAHKVVKE